MNFTKVSKERPNKFGVIYAEEYLFILK